MSEFKFAEVLHEIEHWDGPLFQAAANGRLSTIKLLADAGLDITIPIQKIPLKAAVDAGHRTVIEWLVEAGAPITRDWEVANSGLTRTSWMLNPSQQETCDEILSLLQRRDIPVTRKGIDGEHTLCRVVSCGISTGYGAYDDGCDMNQYKNYEETPLICAISRKSWNGSC